MGKQENTGPVSCNHAPVACLRALDMEISGALRLDLRVRERLYFCFTLLILASFAESDDALSDGGEFYDNVFQRPASDVCCQPAPTASSVSVSVVLFYLTPWAPQG